MPVILTKNTFYTPLSSFFLKVRRPLFFRKCDDQILEHNEQAIKNTVKLKVKTQLFMNEIYKFTLKNLVKLAFNFPKMVIKVLSNVLFLTYINPQNFNTRCLY